MKFQKIIVKKSFELIYILYAVINDHLIYTVLDTVTHSVFSARFCFMENRSNNYGKNRFKPI